MASKDLLAHRTWDDNCPANITPNTFSANPILAGIRSFQYFSQERLSHSETAYSGWNAIIPILLSRKTLSFRDRLFWLKYHHSKSSYKTFSHPRLPSLAGMPSSQFFLQESLVFETANSGRNAIIPILLTRLSHIRDRLFCLKYHHSKSSHKTLSYPRPPTLAEIPSFLIFSQDLLTSEIANSGWNTIIPIILKTLSSRYHECAIRYHPLCPTVSDSPGSGQRIWWLSRIWKPIHRTRNA